MEEILVACIAGDKVQVETALKVDLSLVNLKGKVHPDHRECMMKEDSDDGWTPLHLACHYGKIEIVKLLIENGAAVNCYSEGLHRKK